MSNRLAGETSPYLLQHALNPVDWYPWGEEALARALAEDKPIFLSIGYSACHWCHVMAHESFEDERLAETLNRHFVSIKVDREERPDLDQIYMTAVQAMTGSGGWPMSVFLTPDGRPFYGGTYFPPQPRYGMPSFTAILSAVAEAWRDRRSDLVLGTERILAVLRQPGAGRLPGHVEPGRATLDRAFGTLRHSFDDDHGGWGGAPKFPQPMVLEFLLRYHKATGTPEALHMVTTTLESMARGGMYDQLGGGFHRYSVDGGWQVPHFEKMLYDNAQLSRVYLHGWQVTGNEFFRTIVEEILDYVLREMRHPEGGFFSSQDADSEGEEGRFFVWTPVEIRAILGDGAEAQAFMAAYRVTPTGNLEGRNIPEFVGDVERRSALSGLRRKLFKARQQRVAPGRDTKVVTSWNGLMMASLAEAAGVLDRQDYYRAAEENARFLLREVRTADGRLLHTWRNGAARFNGYLEDYAYLVDGLLELFQATFEPQWFVAARALADTLITHFQAPDGGFFDTSDDHETLITRPRDLQDNATPSGSAMAVTSLLKLSGFTNDDRYVDIAHQGLAQMQSMMAEVPLGLGQWLQALSYALSRPHEIAIVGEPEAEGTQALLTVARDTYRPFQVVALGAPDREGTPVPLLQGRGLVNGRSAAYVCRGFACQAPLSEPEALRALLES